MRTKALTFVSLVFFSLTGYGEDSPVNFFESTINGHAEWRFIGPDRGGRVNGVVGHPVDRLTFYAGYTGGGVWKTHDGGANWKNISDGQIHKGSIGAIAIAQSDPNILFVGTGEQALRGDVSHGDGVYKSTDSGETWVNVGLADTRQIAAIAIHPKNPNIVYVAALGHFAGPNKQRGVFRSTDGGASWEQVLFVDENTGAVSLAMDLNNPKIVFASTWDVRRFPWGIRSAGEGSGLYRSRDGGESWTELSENDGLPKGMWERSAISLSSTKPGRIWALLSAEKDKGLYRSENYGDSWQKVSSDPRMTGRTYYFMKMLADPVDADTVYVLNYNMLRSTDGGKTFEAIKSGHEDHHAFWIDPKDNQRIIDGSDGGAQISFNAGETWSTLYNQPTGQFYSLTTDNAVPYNVYGSQQDWSTLVIPSRRRDARVPEPDVYDISYSEAGRIAVDPLDANILYISDHHWLLRYDRAAGSIQYVGPRDETNYGWGTRDIALRFNWTFPVQFSHHHNKVLYTASQYLHKSLDGGVTWKKISPDLTRADPDKLELTPLPGRDTSKNKKYWGPITRDSNGDHWFSTLYAVSESPINKKILWTGSDDGVVQLTRDSGKNWTNVSPKNLLNYAMITSVDASPLDARTAYITASAYKLNNYKTMVFKTDDFGKSWQLITKGLDENEIMRVVRADPKREGLLYAGSETGVYVSLNNGAQWERLQLNLPAVPVYDMQIKRDDLVIATHGRGFWIFDDLSPIRQLDVRIKHGSSLFKPRDAARLAGEWRDDNPVNGATIYYYLDEPAEEISLVIRNDSGHIVRQIDDGLGAKKGLNKFEWNLRYANASCAQGIVTRGNTQVGPFAAPGKYVVDLHVDGAKFSTELNVEKDPRIPASKKDLEEQLNFLLKIRDKINDINTSFNKARQVRVALRELVAESNSNELTLLAATIDTKIAQIEQELVQPKAKYRKDLHANPVKVNDKFYRLANFVGRSQARPTAAQYDMFDDFSEWSGKAIKELEQVFSDDLARLNTLADQLDMASLEVPESGFFPCESSDAVQLATPPMVK